MTDERTGGESGPALRFVFENERRQTMGDHRPLTDDQKEDEKWLSLPPEAMSELRRLRADNAKLRAELCEYRERDARYDAIRKDVEAVFGTEANDERPQAND
ncbi:MAG: hypothetical protein IID41_07395 [Planctomycetes bacterium]|nr:hypothetical protein [Planctomycetota bacterium]